jgi:hypothetical protein
MATTIEKIETRTSDLSKTVLDPSAPRVKLMLTVDGKVRRVELDMTAEELGTLEMVLSEYFSAAEVSTGTVAAAGNPDLNSAVRRWALSVTGTAEAPTTYTYNGKDLERPAVKGRISQEWKDAYAAWQAVPEKAAAEAAKGK